MPKGEQGALFHGGSYREGPLEKALATANQTSKGSRENYLALETLIGIGGTLLTFRPKCLGEPGFVSFQVMATDFPGNTGLSLVSWNKPGY